VSTLSGISPVPPVADLKRSVAYYLDELELLTLRPGNRLGRLE
jgi:hypothetical protein